MRRFLLLPLLLFLWPFAVVAAAPAFISDLAAGQELTVVVYGTSLTERGTWPVLMQRALHRRYQGRLRLVNSAMSGQTSQWGVLHLQERVLRHRPDVVFVEFAINDAHERFGIDVDEMQQNYRYMIERIRKELPDCEIILMTMSDAAGQAEQNRQFRLHEYYQAVRDLAEDYNLFLIDLYPHWQRLRARNEPLHRRYMPDGLHPTEEATRRFILPLLMKELTGE